MGAANNFFGVFFIFCAVAADLEPLKWLGAFAVKILLLPEICRES